MPAPIKTDLQDTGRQFTIGPLDVLEIDVFGIEGMNARKIQTDPSGRIAFPLAGSVEVVGKTSDEVAGEITTRLRRAHVRNPQVTVNLINAVSQTVTVDGEVKQPGQYPVAGRTTLMRAVASARGTSENAQLEDVVIFRTVEGQRMAALYNLAAIRKGTYGDPAIYPNDVVVVGNSAARQRFKDIIQIASLLTTPIIVALQSFLP